MAKSRLQDDPNAQETREWIEALESILENEGSERAHQILENLIDLARRSGAYLPYSANTAYINTIPASAEPDYPGNMELEYKLRSYVRWNAMAMVVRANRKDSSLGGHIASFSSAAILYDVGLNHFFRVRHPALKGTDHENCGDMIYVQGHCSPGIYAKSLVEGRIAPEQMDRFRTEIGGKGLSSYPHPWLMPDYWEFPTVSMGLGPIMSIYQARFMRYLENRGLLPVTDRKVWAYLGDGEIDEPESLGAITLGAREELDNLVFVVNCNLQRLDGPVRGNGKIIQELEAIFRGAGWNVIKVIWGTGWDPLLMQDKDGLLRERMEKAVDGDYQTYRANSGGYIREFFFDTPELKAMVSKMTDEEIWRLNRGGHDPRKVYAAFKAANEHRGQPTVILAKTIKGYGLGDAGEARNIAHQQKKISDEALKRVRDRFRVPIADDEISSVPYFIPANDSPEMKYLQTRLEKQGGHFPTRNRKAPKLEVPPLETFKAQLAASGDRKYSSTMAFVRILNTLIKDKKIGDRIVPIVADESRTFGMEGMFRQLGIYSLHGQQYRPEDADQLMYYREDSKGQILQEGINEAGAFSSWIAAATSYSNHALPMIPFFIYYSMFGFQRVGDLAWAAGDSRARGFLIGGTSGRTTLNGEGLQHEDGHSQILANTIPNCVTYDPAFACELAVIVQNGLEKMLQKQEDAFYYITVTNENYHHPELVKGSEKDILKGMYLLKKSKLAKAKGHAQLLGSGSILLEVIAAAELLAKDFGIAADIWSATSFNLLARNGRSCERENLLKGNSSKPTISHVSKCLAGSKGPIIASTDHIKLYAEQIRAYVPRTYVTLGTDGFGRSDTRPALRKHFEIDRNYVAYATISALVTDGTLPAKTLTTAANKYGITNNKPDPLTS